MQRSPRRMRLSLVARSPNNQRWRAHSRLLLESSAITHFFLEHFPLLLHGFGLPDLLLGLLELLVDVALAWSKGRASVACYGGGLAVRGRPPHRLDRPGDRPRVRRKARGHRSPAQAAEYGKHARPLDCCDRIAQACGRARAPSTSTSPSASPEYRARVQSTSPEREPAAASTASAALPSASRRREAREVKYLASNGCSLSQPRREPERAARARAQSELPVHEPEVVPKRAPPPTYTRAQHTIIMVSSTTTLVIPVITVATPYAVNILDGESCM